MLCRLSPLENWLHELFDLWNCLSPALQDARSETAREMHLSSTRHVLEQVILWAAVLMKKSFGYLNCKTFIPLWILQSLIWWLAHTAKTYLRDLNQIWPVGQKEHTRLKEGWQKMVLPIRYFGESLAAV